MQLQINDRYRLKGDESQWILESRTRDKKGNYTERYTVTGYFPTIQGAVNSLINHEVRTSDAHTLAEALAAINNIVNEVTEALSPHFTISVSPKKAARR